MRIRLTALALAAAAVACGRTPETTVQVQGTVTAVGSGSAVRDAEVVIEWARAVGGGGTTIHTDRAGRYAARRTVRQKAITCNGMTVNVRKRGFASVYNAYSDSACGADGIVTLDFKLIPLPQ